MLCCYFLGMSRLTSDVELMYDIACGYKSSFPGQSWIEAMIRLARFLVLQVLRRLGVTLARPEQGCIPACRSLSFCSREYPESRLPRLGAISIMNIVDPTQLSRVV